MGDNSRLLTPTHANMPAMNASVSPTTADPLAAHDGLAKAPPWLQAEPEGATLRQLAELAGWAFDVPMVRIVRAESATLRCLAHTGDTGAPGNADGPSIDELAMSLVQERGYGVVTDASTHGSTQAHPWVLGEPHLRFMAAVALSGADGLPVGVFCILGTQVRSLSDREARMLTTLANLSMDHLALRATAHRAALMHAELEQKHGWMMESASQDPLTQVANRRALMAFLDKTLALARREGHPVSVLLLDIQGFKDINQRLGDTVGDRVLLEVASRLAACMRGSELVGRMSGDEFMAVLYPCAADQAELAATRYMNAGSAQPVVLAAAGGLAVSVRMVSGVSTVHPNQQRTSDELYRLAAAALDEAKAKNR